MHTITYAWNKQNNRYEYIIQNNIYGWSQSGNEYYERLLGWGNKNWSEWYSASYAVLATDAVNDYDNYIKATELNILADAYSDNSTKREAYLKALDYQKINVDSMEGLINTYKADSSTTSTDYFNLSKRIIDTYTYYPQAMVEFLNMIKDKVTTPNEVAELDLSENNALLSASNATPSESTCVLMTKQLAEKYLGNVNNELASFSFDGENAGKIVLNSKYDGSEIRVRYSLDGGTNWTETDNHVITLTPEQLASINSTNDIKVGLVGIDDIFTIDILDSKPITESTVYKNDLENLLIGDIDNLEFSLDGGNTWCDYVGGLENGIRFTGDKTVKLRYKAYGHYLQGNSVDYTFTEDTNTPEKTYVQLNNVKLEGYSTQQDDSDHAATNFIDGNYNTGWHTKFNYTDPDKFYTVSFDKVRNITSLEYIASGGFNGMIKDADIYTSLDGENWVKSGSNSSGGSGHHHSSGSSSGSGSNSSSNSGNDASNESNNTVNSENKDDLDNNNNAGIKDSGWSQGNNNSWSYYKDGKPVKNDWVQDNNKWYYMNDSGNMATGWMQSPYSGKWYYLNQSGEMLTNTTVNGYVLGASGEWIK